MIYLDSIAMQAQQLNDNHGLSIFCRDTVSVDYPIWTGVGSLAVSLCMGLYMVLS